MAQQEGFSHETRTTKAPGLGYRPSARQLPMQPAHQATLLLPLKLAHVLYFANLAIIYRVKAFHGRFLIFI